ncbi:MAG: hypothetical protein WD894_10760 [Pirellulales bacterium]
MKTLVRTRRRLFGFEPLESRAMLAGDVTVSVEGDNLIVIGDDNPNTVFIEGASVAGSYVIESDDGTNLFFNGQLQGGAFIVTEAGGKIIIDLNGGDDTLGINNISVDQLIIETDDGDDLVGLGAFAALANLALDGDGGGNGVLPTGPEETNGTLIDNDVPDETIGHFEIQVLDGGESRQGGFTAQGRTLLFANADFIFDYFSFVDVGSNGQGQRLGETTITQAATLIDDDVVESRGFFFGDSEQRINWVVTTSIADGDTRIATSITFSVAPPLEEVPPGENELLQIEQEGPTLGNLRFISYLDEDVGSVADDIMFLSGTPGSAEFKVFTVDGPERVGFAQGGVYSASAGLLQNATWDGWAADKFSDLRAAITGAGTTYSVAGNIDQIDLPPSVDPETGTIFGPADVTTAFAWSVDAQATTATITTFLEFVAEGDDREEIAELDGSVGVNELLVINTHGGNDVVAAVRVFGAAVWDISLGDENDGTTNLTDDNPGNQFVPNVPLNDQAFIFIASGGDIDINAGTGDDLVNINYLTADGTLVIDGVWGNDVVSVNGSVFNDDVVLVGGSGHDTVAVDFSRHDGGDDAVLVIDSGADNDFILFARSLITEGDVYIVSGGGFDRVVVGLYYADVFGNLATGGNVAGTLSIDTGGENDTADIRANVLAELFGVFGGGDDNVTVAFNHITSNDTVGLDGGGGFDKLTSSGNIFGEHVHIHGFEDLIDFLFGDGTSPGLPD